MAGPIFLDLVKEITILTGTGNVTLLGAAGAGFNTFYQAGKLVVGDTFYYVINPGQAEWEVGLGTLLTTTTFSRAPTDSSNSGALVNFSAGTKVVALDAAAAALTTMLFGIIPTSRGGFGANVSAWGGAGFVVKVGAGGVFSSAALLASDIPDLSGTYSTPASVALQIATPTITDFTSAQHTHQNAAGGGTLTTAAIATGTFASDRIPVLDAATKLSGDVAAARIATALAGGTLPFSGTTIAGSTGTFSDTVTGTKNALAVTPADGLLLTNTTAAAAGAQQISPSMHWRGQGWKTDATAASQAVDWQAYVLPVQGAAAPTGRLLWRYSINGGAYSTLMTMDSAGRVGIGAQTPLAPLHAEGDINSSDVLRVVNSNTGAGGGIRMSVANANNAAALFRAGNSVGDIWAVTNAGNTLMGASMFVSAPTARLHVHGATNAVSQIIRLHAALPLDALQVQDSTASVLARIDSTGVGRFMGLRIDQTPVTEAIIPTQTITINVNGVPWKIAGIPA